MFHHQQYIGGGGSLIYAKPTLETKTRNAALQERKEMRGKSEVITDVGKAPSKEAR